MQNPSPTRSLRRQYHIEELMNSLTHGLGAVLSLVGTVILVVMASTLGDPVKITAFTVFGVSLFLLYLASALYHGFRDPVLKRIFKTLDHCAIFVLIAGTYTPFLLVNMHGTAGWVLFAIIWSLALTGVALKLVFADRYKLARVGIYLLMGWLILAAGSDFTDNVNSTGFWLLLSGGLAYTLGVVFYLGHCIPFNHAIWHLFVLGGSTCHYLAMVFSVLPHSVSAA